MDLFKAVIFIVLAVASLVFVTHYLLAWQPFKIISLLLIGAVFVGGSIWGYKQMYREDE